MANGGAAGEDQAPADRPRASVGSEKSRWDKAGVILAPAGSLLTALAVAGVGFFGTRFLNSKQDSDTKQRLYADLMIKREEADVLLRKDMFNSIIATFLTPTLGEPPQDVLKLELLAYNFHDSLNLSPLFREAYRKINSNSWAPDSTTLDKQLLIGRLERVANVVTGTQISTLTVKEPGNAPRANVDLEKLDAHPGGVRIYDHRLQMISGGKTGDKHSQVPDYQPRRFKVDLLGVDKAKKEIRVRLMVSGAGTDDWEVDQYFWVGFFSFPMIDNTRLSHNHRCAVALKEFDLDSGFVEVALVYFPGERASLKEKPYYEEVLHNLRRAEKSFAGETR